MGKEIQSGYDAVVVGAGIGGLLSAAFLARKGYSTCVLEALSFFGGKFTAFDYKGFQVPSGALHLVPGGARGGLGRCFTDLGLDIEYRVPKSGLQVLESGKRYQVHAEAHKIFFPDSFLWRFSWREKITFLGVSYYLYRPEIELPDITFGDLLKLLPSTDRVKKYFNQFMIFANGVDADSASLIEFRESIVAAQYSKEGLVKGGCRHLIRELENCIRRNGGELFSKTRVSRILSDGGKVSGVELEGGRVIKAGLVVTNAGPKRTHQLLGTHTPKWFQEKEKTFLPAYGISYSVASDRPLLEHDNVEISMDHDFLCGYVQVSNLDPSLAPPGKHYLLAAQMVTNPRANIADEIDGGIRDLMDIFPRLNREDIFNVSSFHREWAGAPTAQRMGQSGQDRYPLRVDPFENLYMISHDSQGWGFSGDIIGHAAWKFREMI